MDLELAKEERKIFNTWEKDFGYPIVTPLRKQAKAGTLKELGITEADLDGDPELQENYLDKLNDYARGVVFVMKYSSSSADGSNAQPARTKKGSYNKTFERRFHLVEFVIDSWARDSRSRIDWKRVTAEWNEVHPYDQFENPTSLKSLYNQAIRQTGIIMQLIGYQILKGMEAVRKEGQSFANQRKQFLSQVGEDSKCPLAAIGLLYKHFVLTDKPVISLRHLEVMYTLLKIHSKAAKGVNK